VADTLVRRLPIPALLVRPHDEALDLLESVHEHVFQHVLIPLDGSALAEAIVERAVGLGMLMDAEYTLLQVLDLPTIGYAPALHATGADERILEQWRGEAQSYLDRVAEQLRARGLRVRAHTVIGSPASAILGYAREYAVDAIAIATHGRGGLARVLLGSVADAVLRGAGVPVLLFRPAID
jgi:nucleotide-binding universal stress UspA family protein